MLQLVIHNHRTKVDLHTDFFLPFVSILPNFQKKSKILRSDNPKIQSFFIFQRLTVHWKGIFYARLCNLKMTQKCTRGRKNVSQQAKQYVLTSLSSQFFPEDVYPNCIEGEVPLFSVPAILHVFPKGNIKLSFGTTL